MGLPFEPQSIEQHKHRWHLAIDPLLDLVHDRAGTIAKLATDRPGLHRPHLFDFLDGLRLIVSREFHPQLGEMIHVSGSLGNKVSDNLDQDFSPLPTPAPGHCVVPKVKAIGGPEVYHWCNTEIASHFFSIAKPENFP